MVQPLNLVSEAPLSALKHPPSKGRGGQGCQMAYFHSKYTKLVVFWKMLVYFMIIWSSLRSFLIFYGHLEYIICGHLVYFSRFGMFAPRKIWQPLPRSTPPDIGYLTTSGRGLMLQSMIRDVFRHKNRFEPSASC
jgi:hypothetical protein